MELTYIEAVIGIIAFTMLFIVLKLLSLRWQNRNLRNHNKKLRKELRG